MHAYMSIYTHAHATKRASAELQILVFDDVGVLVVVPVLVSICVHVISPLEYWCRYH